MGSCAGAWLGVVVGALALSADVANSAAYANEGRWTIVAAVGHSSAYEQDADGGIVPTLGALRGSAAHWAVCANLTKVEYSRGADWSASFGGIALGPRYFIGVPPSDHPAGLFLEVLPGLFIGDWFNRDNGANANQLLLGAQGGLGIAWPALGRTGVEIGVRYLVSEGTTTKGYDAPPREFQGLRQSIFYGGISYSLAP